MAPRQTRSMKSLTDFEFITTTILGIKDDSPIAKTFEREGIRDVEGVTSINDRAIDRLKYKETDSSGATTIVELGKGCQSLIQCFNAFVRTKHDEGTPVHGDWQNLVIKEEFTEFRIYRSALPRFVLSRF